MNPIYKFHLNTNETNLLNPNSFTPDCRINENTGGFLPTTAYKTTGYMPVVAGEVYGMKNVYNSVVQLPYLAFYTSDKTYISGITGVSQVTAPANAVYMRLSIPTIMDATQLCLSYGAQMYVAYVSPWVNPIYKDALSMDFERGTDQMFFRRKLNGKLSFIGKEFDWIVGRDIEFQYILQIYISYDGGFNWTNYWNGTFWKTDCEFNEDDKVVSVQPTVNDEYNDVLSGLEKEFDLIQLAPEIAPVKIDKRPVIQVYVPGQSVIGCFLSGMWWEQECMPVEESDTYEGNPALTHKYHFAFNKAARVISITQTGTPTLPGSFYGTKPVNNTSPYDFTSGGYKFTYSWQIVGAAAQLDWAIVRVSDSVTLWSYRYLGTNPPVQYPLTITLQPVSGTGAVGTVQAYIHDVPVYARYVTDVESAMGLSTYPIPDDDLVSDNRNYSRVIGYSFPNTIFIWNTLTSTPTKWGLYQPGKYYVSPAQLSLTGIGEAFPIARATWGEISIWFVADAMDHIAEQRWRKEYTLKDAFPLSSVISVLLNKIAPGITHQATDEYSKFFYDANNPLTGIQQTLLITPKSNLVFSGYDQPAQKAPITLKEVLDMLRDCYRCYWYIEDGKFKIENIKFFNNGGQYTGTPVVDIDLTQQRVARSGKKWAFDTSKYSFEKPTMPSRYQFGWMDDVTTLFDGYPIDIVSKFVNLENIQEISVTKFTSDVDYILLNPGEISKDGFVLLAAIDDGGYKLPYVNFPSNGADHYLQNAYAAFVYLVNFYAYDMPARNYSINGTQYMAYGIKKLKHQTLKFPCLTDPNTLRLIKTNIGNGMIGKLSVNLSSRTANATLEYDTE